MEKQNKCHHFVLKTIMWVLIVIIFLPILAVLAVRLCAFCHSHIKTKGGIDERTYVKSNDEEQYVSIRGKKTDNPVILYVHGGPACPDTSLSYRFSDHLLEEFTFVSYDQRGCGRTYFRNKKDDPKNLTVTFTQIQSDLDALVNYLLSRFNQEKLILVGYSYGSIIGTTYANQHPEKISCYIGVSQMVSMKSDLYVYEDARNKAVAQGNDTRKMDEAYSRCLKDWNYENLSCLRQETQPYHPQTKKKNLIWEGIRTPYGWFSDMKWLMKEAGNQDDFIALNQNLFDDCLHHDLREDSLEFQVPMGFLSGSEDWVTPVKWVKDYQASIQAPKTMFQSLEGCGHTPQLEDGKAFQKTLKSMIQDLLEK